MGCCSSLHADQSLKITNCTEKTIEQGPGWICHAPWSNTELLDKICLSAEEYISITYKNKKDDGDICENLSGPLIYYQTDPFATVEGPLKKKDIKRDEYVIIFNSKCWPKRVDFH